jgi:hypothetical protein
MSLLRTCAVFAALLAAAQAQEQGSLAGTVEDSLKALMPGAQLILRGANGEVAQVYAGKRGEFRFSGLPPGNYSIRAEAPGFHSTTVEAVKVAGSAETTVRIVLEVGPIPSCEGEPVFRLDTTESASTEIVGVVETWASGPVENVSITVTGPKSKRPLASTSTDRTGRFVIPIQKPGMYTVTAHRDGHHDFIVTNVEVRQGMKTTFSSPLTNPECPSRGRCWPTGFTFVCL